MKHEYISIKINSEYLTNEKESQLNINNILITSSQHPSNINQRSNESKLNSNNTWSKFNMNQLTKDNDMIQHQSKAIGNK